MCKRIRLNIGGNVFVTKGETLTKFADTKLAGLNKNIEEYDEITDEYYFDRDPELFRPILNLYRTNELHLPRNLCGYALKREMDFWGIKEELVAECCWKVMYKVRNDTRIGADIEDTGESCKPVPVSSNQFSNQCTRLRFSIWKFLAKPNSSNAARIWNTVYFGLVLLSVTILVIQTHPALRVPRQGLFNSTLAMMNYTSNKTKYYLQTDFLPLLFYLDVICVSIFTLELTLHFITSPYKSIFFRCQLNIIDAVVIAANWGSLILERGFSDVIMSYNTTLITVVRILKYISVLRVVRFFKLTERFISLRIMVLAIRQASGELLMMFMYVIIVATLFGCILFIVEFETNDVMSDIPHAIWWAIITMTTVGYGDVVPKTVGGRVVGTFCAIAGLMVLSMPVAIIASNFNDYHEKEQVICENIEHRKVKRERGRFGFSFKKRKMKEITQL